MGFAKGAPHPACRAHPEPVPSHPGRPGLAPPFWSPSIRLKTNRLAQDVSLSASLAQHVFSVTRVLGVPAAHASLFGVRAHTFVFTTGTQHRARTLRWDRPHGPCAGPAQATESEGP